MSKKPKSIPSTIIISSVGLIFVFTSLLIIFNIINVKTLRQYHAALQEYHTLAGYYDELDSATMQLKDYLYSGNKASLKAYEVALDTSYDYVKQLKDADGFSEKWRFDLMDNMTQYYEEQCTIVITSYENESEAFDEHYTQMNHVFSLVKNTSGTYYKVITHEMSKQQSALDQNQHVIMIGSFALIFLFFILLSLFASRMFLSVIRPIRTLLENINRIKLGKYDLREIQKPSLEMEQLHLAVEEMASSVQKNISYTEEKRVLETKLLEQENENLKKDELLAQSELRLLQDQINPHFLFNTLNMIYRLSQQEHADMTSTMLEKTSSLLRYGLSKQHHSSDLKSELTSIQNYMDIQSIRFGERITFVLKVPEELPSIELPGMILQPLVENAIKHGLNDCMELGEIMVSVTYEEGILTMSVSDNGCGMDTQTLDEMVLHEYHIQGEDHVGLSNVVRRLEMVWHDQVSFTISSSQDCGFEVIIQIRVEEGVMKHVSCADR